MAAFGGKANRRFPSRRSFYFQEIFEPGGPLGILPGGLRLREDQNHKKARAVAAIHYWNRSSLDIRS